MMKRRRDAGDRDDDDEDDGDDMCSHDMINCFDRALLFIYC